MGVALPFPSETFLSGRCFAPPPENFAKSFQTLFAQSPGVPKAPEKNVPKALQDITKRFPFSKVGYNSFETPDPPFQWHRKKVENSFTTLKQKKVVCFLKLPHHLGPRGEHLGIVKLKHLTTSERGQSR